jgi:hypothetical protein
MLLSTDEKPEPHPQPAEIIPTQVLAKNVLQLTSIPMPAVDNRS